MKVLGLSRWTVDRKMTVSEHDTVGDLKIRYIDEFMEEKLKPLFNSSNVRAKFCDNYFMNDVLVSGMMKNQPDALDRYFVFDSELFDDIRKACMNLSRACSKNTHGLEADALRCVKVYMNEYMEKQVKAREKEEKKEESPAFEREYGQCQMYRAIILNCSKR